jgi:hypothetical protein
MKFLNNAILGQDILYYNCNIRYNKNENKGLYTIASKQFNNDEVILRNPCEYYLAIPKLVIPTRAIPIFRCIPIDGASIYYIDENTLIYLITMRAVSGAGLDDSPVTVALQMDTSLVGGTPKDLDYYSIFEYTRFIEMLNVAISSAWTTMSNLSAANLALFGTVASPFFYFNSETQRIEYYGEKGIPATPTEDVEKSFELYFNKPLSVYFQGFKSVYNIGLGDDNIFYQRVLDADFDLYATAGYEDFYTTNINGVEYFKFVSDYNIIGNWNTLQSIQIFSNIPINREFVDDFYKPQAGKQITQNEPTKYNLLLKELFVFTTDDNQLVRTNIDYQVDEFDFIDISKGCDELRNFTVDVSYTTQTGEKYPLRIANGDSFLMKLMFIRKDYLHSFE